VALLALGGGTLFVLARRGEPFRERSDAALLRLPLDGRLARGYNAALPVLHCRFCHYSPIDMAYTLTSKSQVTLPKAIRDHLRVAPGDTVSFRIVADGTVRVEPARSLGQTDLRKLGAAQARFERLRGSGGHSGQAGTDALMGLLRGYEDDAADPGFASMPAEPRRRG
jgi:AbrB family looped-hinge helix DNA binding protein